MKGAPPSRAAIRSRSPVGPRPRVRGVAGPRFGHVRLGLHAEEGEEPVPVELAGDGQPRHAAGNGELIALMEPGSNGFIRIVMRGLARERQSKGFGEELPFMLTRWSDGRLTISDPTTGRKIMLTGFGKDNVNAFAKLLLAGSEAK